MYEVILFSGDTCVPCKQLMPHLVAACAQKQIPLIVYNTSTDLDKFMIHGVRSTPTVFLTQEQEPVAELTARSAVQIIKELDKFV